MANLIPYFISGMASLLIAAFMGLGAIRQSTSWLFKPLGSKEFKGQHKIGAKNYAMLLALNAMNCV